MERAGQSTGRDASKEHSDGTEDNPVVARFWEDALSTLTDPIDPGFMREFQESPLMSRAFLEIVVRESLKVSARVWREAWKALLEADHSGELGKIESLTLIVWGDQDEIIPWSEQDTLAAAIAGSRLVVYPGIGHGLHWDDPGRFSNDLVAFTENVAGWDGAPSRPGGLRRRN